ncbi:hypothetical protein C8R47DRAFT_1216998 [Mycena vitilis]|nr:hypothetical protein C8R47DRAFT_1216998 [Mycena vitilis]
MSKQTGCVTWHFVSSASTLASSSSSAPGAPINLSPHKAQHLDTASDATEDRIRSGRERDSPTNRKGSIASSNFPAGLNARPLPFNEIATPRQSSRAREHLERRAVSPTPRSRGRSLIARTQTSPAGTSQEEEDENETAGHLQDEDAKMTDVEPESQIDLDADGDDDSAFGVDGVALISPTHATADTQPIHPPPVPPVQRLPPAQPTGVGAFVFGNQGPQAPQGFGFTQPPPQPAFVMPTEAAFLARPPKNRSKNPHRKARLYEETLRGPDDLKTRVTFQRNTEAHPFPQIVLDGEIATANVAKGFVATLRKYAHQYALVSVFLGGAQLFDVYGLENLITDMTSVIVDARLATEDDIDFIPLIPEDKDPHPLPYAPPFILALRVTDDDIRDRLFEICNFPSSLDLVFSIVEYRPDTRTWTISLMKASRGGGSVANGKNLRWQVANAILTDPKIARAYERATGGADVRPILVRLLEFARTIDTRYNPHSGHWAVFGQPPVDISCADWEAIKVTIRGKTFIAEAAMVAFEPVSCAAGTDAPWCLICKNDDHVHYGCYFTKDDPDNWQGMTDQLNRIRGDGILARPWKKKTAAPRASGPPNQSRNVGGGRGASRGGNASAGSSRGGAPRGARGTRGTYRS